MAAAKKIVEEVVEVTPVEVEVAPVEEGSEPAKKVKVVDPNPTGYELKLNESSTTQEMRDFVLKFQEFAKAKSLESMITWLPEEAIRTMPASVLMTELRRHKLLIKGKTEKLDKGIFRSLDLLPVKADLGGLLGNYTNDSAVRLEISIYAPATKSREEWQVEIANFAATLTA